MPFFFLSFSFTCTFLHASSSQTNKRTNERSYSSVYHHRVGLVCLSCLLVVVVVCAYCHDMVGHAVKLSFLLEARLFTRSLTHSIPPLQRGQCQCDEFAKATDKPTEQTCVLQLMTSVHDRGRSVFVFCESCKILECDIRRWWKERRFAPISIITSRRGGADCGLRSLARSLARTLMISA